MFLQITSGTQAIGEKMSNYSPPNIMQVIHSIYLFERSIRLFLSISPFYIVNGNYSDWGPYGECSKSCGGGLKMRNRTCTNPPPANGGEDCSVLGPDTSTMKCNIQECPGKMGVQSVVSFVILNSKLQIANKCKGMFIDLGVTTTKISMFQKILSPIVYLFD